jgi:hypothetical protein
MQFPASSGIMDAVWRVTCLMGAAVCLWMGFSLFERGTDFNQFYAAAQLAGSGHLYDFESIQALELQHSNHPIPFGRFPVYAVLMKPLTVFGYRYARGIWMLINLAAMAGFALLWPSGRRRDLCMMLCWSCPAAILLSTGQDTALFLFFVAAGLRLLQLKRDAAAGLIFSLCAAKIHLALGIPIFLLARKRWGALAGGLAGGLLQLAISTAAEGPQWLTKLWRLSAISDFSPSPEKMPNLLGLTHALPFGIGLEALLGMLSLAAVWIVARRSPLAIGATAAVAAGLLVSHHAYVYDGLLLLPAVALLLRLPAKETLRYAALALCTPIPYLLLMQEHGSWAVAQLAINGVNLSLLAMLALHALKRSAPELQTRRAYRVPAAGI